VPELDPLNHLAKVALEQVRGRFVSTLARVKMRTDRHPARPTHPHHEMKNLVGERREILWSA